MLALAPEEAELEARLTSLVRKELVRPERATLPGEEAYRFRHLLIRDAAYEALPKSLRAELHERFAAWLELRGNDLVEQEEVVGYHLERAYRYRIVLGPLDEHGRELAARAADRLGSAGRLRTTVGCLGCNESARTPRKCSWVTIPSGSSFGSSSVALCRKAESSNARPLSLLKPLTRPRCAAMLVSNRLRAFSAFTWLWRWEAT